MLARRKSAGFAIRETFRAAKTLAARRSAQPQRFILLYLCATALSALFSQFRQTALWGGGRCEGFAAIALYCLSFLLLSTHVRPKRWMLWLYAAALSVNCAICLVRFAGLNPLYLYPEGMNYYGANTQYAGEFLGTVGNADILSAVLSLSIPAFSGGVCVRRGCFCVKSNRNGAAGGRFMRHNHTCGAARNAVKYKRI